MFQKSLSHEIIDVYKWNICNQLENHKVRIWRNNYNPVFDRHQMTYACVFYCLGGYI